MFTDIPVFGQPEKTYYKPAPRTIKFYRRIMEQGNLHRAQRENATRIKRMLLSGYNDSEIAQFAGCRRDTVAVHRKRLGIGRPEKTFYVNPALKLMRGNHVKP